MTLQSILEEFLKEMGLFQAIISIWLWLVRGTFLVGWSHKLLLKLSLLQSWLHGNLPFREWLCCRFAMDLQQSNCSWIIMFTHLCNTSSDPWMKGPTVQKYRAALLGEGEFCTCNFRWFTVNVEKVSLMKRWGVAGLHSCKEIMLENNKEIMLENNKKVISENNKKY